MGKESAIETSMHGDWVEIYMTCCSVPLTVACRLMRRREMVSWRPCSVWSWPASWRLGTSMCCIVNIV